MTLGARNPLENYHADRVGDIDVKKPSRSPATEPPSGKRILDGFLRRKPSFGGALPRVPSSPLRACGRPAPLPCVVLAAPRLRAPRVGGWLVARGL